MAAGESAYVQGKHDCTVLCKTLVKPVEIWRVGDLTVLWHGRVGKVGNVTNRNAHWVRSVFQLCISELLRGQSCCACRVAARAELLRMQSGCACAVVAPAQPLRLQRCRTCTVAAHAELLRVTAELLRVLGVRP